jgi:hypothetical protein
MLNEINLNHENFHYRDLVDQVDDQIIDFVFAIDDDEEHNIEFDFIWPYPVDPSVFDGDYSRVFIVEVTAHINNDISSLFNIEANAGLNGEGYAYIGIQIEYKQHAKLANHLHKFIGNLRGVLAHEIHHLTQEPPLKRINCPEHITQKKETFQDYFTSSCEVPAYVIGFRAEASHSKKPIKKLMSNYLNNYIKAGVITSTEADNVYNTWTEFNAKLTDFKV